VGRVDWVVVMCAREHSLWYATFEVTVITWRRRHITTRLASIMENLRDDHDVNFCFFLISSQTNRSLQNLQFNAFDEH
jgi:hypothetical protein